MRWIFLFFLTFLPFSTEAQISERERKNLFEQVEKMCEGSSSIGEHLKIEGELGVNGVLRVVGGEAGVKITRETWRHIEHKYGEFFTVPPICRREMLKLLLPLYGEVTGFDRFIGHSFTSGHVPEGYSCTADSDCVKSGGSGHCYPALPNNQFSFCIHHDSNCALPGTSGVMYGRKETYEGRTYVCYRPASGKARWKLD